MLLGLGEGVALGIEPGGHLGRVERTQDAQQVGHALDAARAAVRIEALGLALELSDDVGVEQLAHLDLAEQLAQQRRIDRQGGRPPLGEGGIALVHEGADVAEQQIPGVGRGLRGRDLDEPDAAFADLSGQTQQGGQVVDVLQHLAQRLEDDRERRMPLRDLEQLGGALSLLPERGPAVGVEAGQQQGAGRALAEARGEQGRTADLVGDDLLELVGLEDEQVGAGRLGRGVGHARDDAVVTGDRGALDAEPLADARALTARAHGECTCMP